MTVAVRRATERDVPRIVELVRALADYEKAPAEAIATEADFLRDGFGPEPAFRVLVAEDPSEGPVSEVPPEAGRQPEGPTGEVVGFALYFFTWSTWRGRRCLHLEDLFVEPAHRGRQAGLSLMRALAREAIAEGCPRFVWQVLDWNEPAIRFYEKLGATVLPEWRNVRLEGEALAALAGDCPQTKPAHWSSAWSRGSSSR
jgi:GNAT superfamily N-acetyltransferase